MKTKLDMIHREKGKLITSLIYLFIKRLNKMNTIQRTHTQVSFDKVSEKINY